MTIGNFLEILGSDGFDSLTGSDLEIIYGDSDGDSLVAGTGDDSNVSSTTILVGGTGRNFYSVRENATAIIFENSGSTDNSLYTTILALGIDSSLDSFVIADIDSRHLYFGNKISDQYVFLVDWQQPENRIENFDFVNGNISYESLLNSYQTLPGYLGNLSLEEITEEAETELARLRVSSDKMDESIATIFTRASELEPPGRNVTNPPPSEGEVGILRELLGTESSNSFSGFDGEIIYGLGGNDALATNYGHLARGKATSFLVGGTGDNTYTVGENATAIIIESGNSNNEFFAGEIALDISNQETASIIAEIDNRHLFLGNTAFNQYVILIDWQKPENQIETFNLVEGRISYESFVNNFRDSNGYQGNLTWEELEAQELIDLTRLDLEPVSIEDSLNTIIERSLSLEGRENNGDDNEDNNPSENNQIGNFLEILGTDGFDSISGADLQIIYSLAGDDVLNSFPNFSGGALPNGRETTILVGGSGSNDYQVRNNSTAIVIENDNRDDNILWTTIGNQGSQGIGLEKASSFFIEIENKHLYLGDTASDQYVILVDWQQPENQIESFDLVEGRTDYADFVDSFRNSAGYQGNIAWDELPAQIDLERLGLETASIENTFEQIKTRATELEDRESQTMELFRFRNVNFATGTYIFVSESEKNAIQDDENLSNSFALEGSTLNNIATEETVNSAFTASLEPEDNLLPFYRLSSNTNPGTFLFVSTEEYNTIFAEDSEQRDKWEKQGFNTTGEDIPEFYLYGVGSEMGTKFHRFQNRENGTFLFAGEAETEAINNDPNLSNIFIDQGVSFVGLL